MRLFSGHIASFKIGVLKVQDFGNFELLPMGIGKEFSSTYIFSTIILNRNKVSMHLNKILFISLESLYIFKTTVLLDCNENLFFLFLNQFAQISSTILCGNACLFRLILLFVKPGLEISENRHSPCITKIIGIYGNFFNFH